jgi:hypothetical protein
MNEFQWAQYAVITDNGYRPLVDEAPDYCIGPAMHIWRLPTVRAGKSGSTRLLKAHQITPDNGQVSLRRDGKTYRHSVAKLHRKYHPDRYRSVIPAELVPERLRPLDRLMREKPAGTGWGAGTHSPGCHGFAARGSFSGVPVLSKFGQRCPTDIHRNSIGRYRTGQIGQDSDRTGQLLGEASG